MKTRKQSKLHIWQAKGKSGGECANCKHKVQTLTVDHIIPVSFIEVLDRTGLLVHEWEDNFQYMCRACNQFKSNRIDITNPKTKELLQALINQI
jgi:5-methylcytosine-specific restriction endonuclease McrA